MATLPAVHALRRIMLRCAAPRCGGLLRMARRLLAGPASLPCSMAPTAFERRGASPFPTLEVSSKTKAFPPTPTAVQAQVHARGGARAGGAAGADAGVQPHRPPAAPGQQPPGGCRPGALCAEGGAMFMISVPGGRAAAADGQRWRVKITCRAVVGMPHWGMWWRTSSAREGSLYRPHAGPAVSMYRV